MGIERTGSFTFLRNYNYPGLSKAVVEAQAEVGKEPAQTAGQILGKMAKVVGYTGVSVAAQAADIPFSLGLSAIRAMGFFNPLPPEPPKFPIPRDNAHFMEVSIDRALWDWSPTLQNELKEAISNRYSEKWDLFNVVGEWCIANSYENAGTPNYHKPTFLTASASLENGETFRSTGIAFGRLRQNDKAAILNAIYHQAPIESVSEAGLKVYKDIRELASKLKQGNEAYLSTFSEYVKQIEEIEAIGSQPSAPAPTPAPPLAQRISAPPQTSASVHRPVYPAIPSQRQYQTYVPTYVPVYPSAPAFPSAPSYPTAPDLSTQSIYQTEEDKNLSDLNFVRTAVEEAVDVLPVEEKTKIYGYIKKDTVEINDVAKGHVQMEQAPRCGVARLALLQFFKKAFKEGRDVPDFFWINALNANGKTLQETGQAFALFDSRDYNKLQQTILHPMTMLQLDPALRKRLAELHDFAEVISKNPDFFDVYQKYKESI